MHNQYAGLSEVLAAQRSTERHEQAAQTQLARSAGRSRRHRWRLARGWWWLAPPAKRHRPAGRPASAQRPLIARRHPCPSSAES